MDTALWYIQEKDTLSYSTKSNNLRLRDPAFTNSIALNNRKEDYKSRIQMKAIQKGRDH